MTFARIRNSLSAPLAAFGIGVLVSSLALLVGGKSPIQAFYQMWDFGHRGNNLIYAVDQAIPTFIAALAVAVAFKVNLFNIGVEYQSRLAAIIAAAVAAKVAGPGWFAIAVATLVAVLVGAVYAGIAGVLRAYRNVNEVVTTIMLNLVGVSILAVLLKWDKVATIEGQAYRTPRLPESRQFPFVTIAGTELWLWIVPAALLGVGFHYLVNRSTFGFELRASGINPGAAKASGVNPKRMILTTMLISGGIAGLVGMPHLFQDKHYFQQDFPGGFGFEGIAIALVGRGKAGGMAVAALLFAFIDSAALGLTSQPLFGTQEIGTILKGTMMLAAVIAYEVVRRRNEATAIEQAARATTVNNEVKEVVG
jgi:general nucleoside transport system permease protein